MDEIGVPIEQAGEGRGDNSVTLFLGLYLLVLAFFILLVTISTLEEVKSSVVMDSLTSTFAAIQTPTTDLTTFSTKEGDVLAGQQFQDQVAGVFATAIRVAKVEVVQPGRLMRVIIPSDSLFLDGKKDIRETRYPMLDRLVASLSGRPRGLRYDMEFVIGAKYAVGSSLPIGQTLEMARAGGFAREMLSRGVPSDSVAIGLTAGDPKEIAMWFFVRNIDETKLRFQTQVAADQPSENPGGARR